MTVIPAPSERRRAIRALLALRAVRALEQVVESATARGDADQIVVAYLDLARAHIDDHRLADAIAALERAVELLATAPVGPAWRLLLTLAALYAGTGDRSRAQLTASAARDHAVRSGSALGRARADELIARLSRTRRASRRPPW